MMKRFMLVIAFLLVSIAAAGSSSGKGKGTSTSSKSSRSSLSSGKGRESPSRGSSKSKSKDLSSEGKGKGKDTSPSSSSSGKDKGTPSGSSSKLKSNDSSSKASKVSSRSSKSGSGKGKGKRSSLPSSSSGMGKRTPSSSSSKSQSKESSSKASKVRSQSSSSSEKGKNERSSPTSPSSSAKSNKSLSRSSSKTKSKQSSSKASTSSSSSKDDGSSPSESTKGSQSSPSKAGTGAGSSPSESSPDSSLPQMPDTEGPKTCVCSANATFEKNVLTMNFDMCEEEPMVSDWVGIYRCDAATTIADEEWWNDQLESPGYIGEPGVSMEYYGFVPGQEYVIDQQLWWSYTCSSPTNGEEQCQQSDSTVWPAEGSVTVDPSVAPRWAFWGQAFGGVLDPGCYKVLLNREVSDEFSPPPLPTVCPGQPWQNAFEFEVEAESEPAAPDTTPCICSANATFENNMLTMNFDMCEEEPMVADWVGIYRCDAATTIANEEWWNDQLESPGYIGEPGVSMEYYGFVPGQEYVIDQQLWWSYTCSSPTNGEDQCQQSDSTVWPAEGSVTVDPSVAPPWAFWGQALGGVLDPGCYKVMLNREVSDEFSPPPLPTVCPGQPWQNAFEFEVE